MRFGLKGDFPWTLAPALVALAAVGVVIADTIPTSQTRVGALYILTVLTAVFFFGRVGVWLVSAICIAFALGNSLLAGESPLTFGPELIAIAASAYLGLKIKSAETTAQEARLQVAHFGRLSVLGELTTSIAHEVNQPLAAVVANANAGLVWLDHDPPNRAEAIEALNRIIRDANRASEIVARVRGLARRNGKRGKGLTDANKVVLEMLAMTRHQLAEARVVVRTELAEGLPMALIDRTELQQVLLNLIVNAIEAMANARGTQKELSIATGHGPRTSITLSVADTGPGFATANPNQLFEPFYSTKPEGMGMGLAISRSIVEANGGTIDAAPVKPRGAQFTIVLPASRSDKNRMG